jgi:hypothetical protein
VEFTTWRGFRDSEDSRYVALTLPHVLGRLPYGSDFERIDAFAFEEFVDGKGHDKYLWMNAAWAYAARVTDAYARDGWFMRTRGVEGGGRVEGLPLLPAPGDGGDVAMKCPTEIVSGHGWSAQPGRAPAGAAARFDAPAGPRSSRGQHAPAGRVARAKGACRLVNWRRARACSAARRRRLAASPRRDCAGVRSCNLLRQGTRPRRRGLVPVPPG